MLRAEDRDAFVGSVDAEVRHRQGWDDAAVANIDRFFDRLDGPAWRALVLAQQLVVVCNGAFAGSYTVTPSSFEGADVELGWWLAAQARGKGLGQASLAAVLDHVHRGIGARVARMGTNADNVRAIRQIEAVGAVRVADTDHTLPNGCVVKGYWYHHTAD